MAGKQAKILSNDQVERLLSFASTTRNPLRNRVLILLSLKAGLRVGEIAKLTWPMVLDPRRRKRLGNRTAGPGGKEGQRAIRFTRICAAPWSRWCKPAVRAVNWLTNVYLLSS